jgi:hypothetical protein
VEGANVAGGVEGANVGGAVERENVSGAVEGANVGGGVASHPVWLGFTLTPAAHSRQEDSQAPEYLPAGHFVHAILR